jgi:hypothetical protein
MQRDRLIDSAQLMELVSPHIRRADVQTNIYLGE